MKNYLGVLGDPAKSELYEKEFFQLLDWDESESTFHLLGASENDVSRNDYAKMYQRFSENLSKRRHTSIQGLSGKSYKYHARIGLFPSSTSHLIKGPSFSFAPVPINSESRYLRLKSKFLQLALKPFLPFSIRNLAYFPLGGKAARKTKADVSFDKTEIPDIFAGLRKEDNFDWYYLEAGSGQNFLSYDLISQVMLAQVQQLPNISEKYQQLKDGSRLVIPRFIYGGGIRSRKELDTLLEPNPNRVKLIPEAIIIGNISEENIDTTYELVSRVAEFNEILS